ncbi:MAG: hypothetical protein WA188_01310 [Terriglobales bacterium]
MIMRLALAVLLLTIPFNEQSAQSLKTKTVSNGFLKAREFLDLSEAEKTGFAWGFVDGLFVAPLLDAPDDGKFYVGLRSCAAEMQGTQVAAIIEKYIKDHPEDWHQQLHVVAFNALLKGCHIT